MNTTLIKKIFLLNNTTYFLIWLIVLAISIFFEIIYWTDDLLVYAITLFLGTLTALIPVTLMCRLFAYIIILLSKSNLVIKMFYMYSWISLLFLLGIYIKSLTEMIITKTTIVEMSGAVLFLFPVYVGLCLPLREAKKD